MQEQPTFTFIQQTLLFEVTWSASMALVHMFPENWTHDFGVASAVLYRNLWAIRIFLWLCMSYVSLYSLKINGRVSPNHMHSSVYKCADFPFTNAPLLLVSPSLLFAPFPPSPCSFVLSLFLQSITTWITSRFLLWVLQWLCPSHTTTWATTNTPLSRLWVRNTHTHSHSHIISTQTAVTSCNVHHKRHACSSRSLYPQPLITIANDSQCHWLQGIHTPRIY